MMGSNANFDKAQVYSREYLSFGVFQNLGYEKV